MANQFLLLAQTDAGPTADPWKWQTFHTFVISSITSTSPILIVLLCGMFAAIVFRRRLGIAFRPLFLGCLALALRQLVAPLSFWIWAIIDPAPRNPAVPADAQAFVWTSCAIGWPLEVAGVWLLAKAVLVGRSGRAEPEGAP